MEKYLTIIINLDFLKYLLEIKDTLNQTHGFHQQQLSYSDRQTKLNSQLQNKSQKSKPKPTTSSEKTDQLTN